MADAAVWYLVVKLTSSLMAPTPQSGLLVGPDPLVGPITEVQCHQTETSLSPLPGVVSVRCRKAVGMQTIANGAMAYAYPIFEGDLLVPVGKVD